jgi:hypothetical protein
MNLASSQSLWLWDQAEKQLFLDKHSVGATPEKATRQIRNINLYVKKKAMGFGLQKRQKQY